MRIKRMEVVNFRALRNAQLAFESTTALIGENNSGKSAFLIALDLFFSNSPRTTETDYSDGNTSAPIDITVHFSDLTPYDRAEFESNLIDGALIVTRRLLFSNVSESGRYFVSAKVNPEFSKCRNEEGKTEKRKLYSELREKYGDALPKEKNADEVNSYLEAWEAANPGVLKLERVAGFKGWKNVAAGKLKEKTDYIFIRAVQDATEDIQGSKNSPVKNLVDTIARQTIENNPKYQEFLQTANKQIYDFTNPENVPALAEISGSLTSILQTYYKDSEIIASWSPIESIQPAFPTSEIELKDHDFVTPIDGVGHGLQRAVILTVLQYMAERRAHQETGENFGEAQSDIIIAIEEPEIYQHPVKQRLFSKILGRLSHSFNEQTGIRIQTIYVTHSPLLVSLPACEQVRLIRYRGASENKVSVTQTSLDACAKRSAAYYDLGEGEAWSPAKMAAKLHTFRGEITEGFFGKCVLLVEGVGDKAVLDAWIKASGRDAHAEGIVIADVVGKNNLGKPIVVFEGFSIPCYWVFDNDFSDTKKSGQEKTRENRALQRMGGVTPADCVDFPAGVFARFAVWDGNLENYVRKIAGDKFTPLANAVSAEFDVLPSDCLKFPGSAAAMLERLCNEGLEFPEFKKIVAAVDALIES